MPTRPVAVIIGMMGAGKTRVGKEVAQLMSLPFADADVEIEHEVGMRIPEYFERHGEPAFREVESEVIAGMLHGFGGVFALGGGAPMTPAIADALAAHTVVWLQVDAHHALKRVGIDEARPLLAGTGMRATLIKLLNERTPTYQRLATHAVDTAGRTPDDIAAELIDRLEERS